MIEEAQLVPSKAEITAAALRFLVPPSAPVMLTALSASLRFLWMS